MKRFSWVLLILFFIGFENDLAEVNKFFSKEKVTYEIAKDVEILYSDSAIIRVRIKAPTLKRYLKKNNQRQEFPDGVQVDFFNAKRQITGKLSSKFAVRYEKKNEIIVRDSVVWKSANNEELETSELIWDENKKIVYTNKFVTIKRPGEILYGYGFESNEDFTESRIKAVTGRTRINIE